jgi:hypothetical protein
MDKQYFLNNENSCCVLYEYKTTPRSKIIPNTSTKSLLKSWQQVSPSAMVFSFLEKILSLQDALNSHSGENLASYKGVKFKTQHNKMGNIHVTQWCDRIIAVGMEMQQCVLCVLLSYMSLSTI